MLTVACVMMQRDEKYLLRPWLTYYSALFGPENLFVFDNGSELDEVRSTLADFEQKGVRVDRTRSTRRDYEQKGNIVGEMIRSLDATRKYDFIMPLDCDEFLILQTQNGYACTKEGIRDYLATLTGEPRVLRVPYQMANHPLQADLYHYFNFFKVFFATGTFAWMDHGYHNGRSSKAEGTRDTRLVHLHFHYKNFGIYLEQARKTWTGSIDLNDKEKLKTYVGSSRHLAPYFLKDKEEYYGEFMEYVQFYMPEFGSFMASLGAPLNLPGEAVAENLIIKPSSRDPSAKFDGSGTVTFVPGKTPSGTEFVTTEFDEWLYVQANPDLIGIGMEPTAHFCRYGFKESRLLRPPEGLRSGVALPEQDTTDADAGDTGTPGKSATITERVIAAYIAGTGPIVPDLDGKRCLELGAGSSARHGWLTTDRDARRQVLQLDVRYPFPIEDCSFDYIFSEHLIEHLRFEAGQFMLRECFRVLKPRATIRIATPSIGFLLRLFSEDRSELEDRYITWATKTFLPDAPKPMPSFVFNNFVRSWGHQFMYDRATLRLALASTGFDDIKELGVGQSEHEKLRGLEKVHRLPHGFLALESMIFEATRPMPLIAK